MPSYIFIIGGILNGGAGPPAYAYGSRLALRNHLGATHNTNFIANVSL